MQTFHSKTAWAPDMPASLFRAYLCLQSSDRSHSKERGRWGKGKVALRLPRCMLKSYIVILEGYKVARDRAQ